MLKQTNAQGAPQLCGDLAEDSLRQMEIQGQDALGTWSSPNVPLSHWPYPTPHWLAASSPDLEIVGALEPLQNPFFSVSLFS